MMNDHMVWALGKARQQTFNLVADLSEAQLCQQTVVGENHPAWTLGHLFLADCYFFMMLDIPHLPHMPAGWLELYMPGKAPLAESNLYHPKEVLISHLQESGRIRQEVVASLSAEALAQPTKEPNVAKIQPTVGHLLHYFLFHEGNHGGQLASWRKRYGLPSGSGAFGIV